MNLKEEQKRYQIPRPLSSLVRFGFAADVAAAVLLRVVVDVVIFRVVAFPMAVAV